MVRRPRRRLELPQRLKLPLRVITLNVNGIRSAAKKGLFRWLAAQRADVVCLQEIKCQEPDLDAALHSLKGHASCYGFAEKKGYSGVALYSRKQPDEIRRDVRPQIYILTVADKATHRLETGFTENQAPDWSPDGRTLAFVCSKGRGEENDVCVIPAAGGPVRNLTTAWALDPQNPSWSPDGKTIYISAETRASMCHRSAARSETTL